MKSLWSDKDAQQYPTALAQRVYTSRLLGQEPGLVLHGGGNTSVKDTVTNFFGEQEALIYVKGSGWDLATIEAPGFAPVKMDTLLKMAALDHLSDEDMVTYQRAAMTDPAAPNPSVEAILHAIIPFKFVDHTHTDAVVTITNTPEGEQRIRALYGDKVFIIPYVMPGFALAQLVYQMTKDLDWHALEGMVLMNHGLFTFADNAKDAYEKTIELVTKAEQYLVDQNAVLDVPNQTPGPLSHDELMALATLRRKVSSIKNIATLANLNQSDIAVHFAQQANVQDIVQRGPLTPDHVIRTKRIAAVIKDSGDINTDIHQGIDEFVAGYQAYFAAHKTTETCLNPAPNYAIWQNKGSISFGTSVKETLVTQDITEHTFAAILTAEKLSRYQALPEKDIFDVEYWSLEQAKLKKGGAVAPLSGQIVIVSEALTDIGAATINKLLQQGASVVAIDSDDNVSIKYNKVNCIGIKTADFTMGEAVYAAVRHFGGVDIVVSACGNESLIRHATPFLMLGVNPSIINISSVNVSTTIRNNQINYGSHVSPEQVAEMIVTVAGPTFHAVHDATIVLGE